MPTMSGCSIRLTATRAFMSGLPLWGTLIGLTRHGKPGFGMMHQPFIGERFSGDGGAAEYRGPHGTRSLTTRDCPDLAEATLMATSPDMFNGNTREAFARVQAKARLTRFGCDCYAYCMVAAGHVDLVIENGLKPYDIVPLIPIIEGGGRHRYQLGRGATRPRAGRSSRRVTGACMSRQ